MKDNQSDNNIINNEKQIVLEEISRWGRTINNTVWIVTSFFIALNFLLIRSTFYEPISCFIMNNHLLINLILIIFVLLLLWIIPVLFVLSMIVISKNLSDLFYYDSLKIRNLKSKLEFNHKRKRREVWELIRFPRKSIKNYPWTWILFALTLFFIGSWVLILYILN